MKEWILKHPIMTFLLADTAIAGVINLVKYTVAAFAPNRVVEIDPYAPACKEELEETAEETEE